MAAPHRAKTSDRPAGGRGDLAVAVRTGRDGVLIDLEVRPGAEQDRFPDGLDPWRRRIRMRVVAPAVHGAANRAVCDLVARRLGLDGASVALTNGTRGPLKTVHLGGLSVEEVVQRLQEDAS